MIRKLDENTIALNKSQPYAQNIFLIVKELIENSLDSKATTISIKILENEIVVTDNGSGISDFTFLGSEGFTSKFDMTRKILPFSLCDFQSKKIKKLDLHSAPYQENHQTGILHEVQESLKQFKDVRIQNTYIEKKQSKKEIIKKHRLTEKYENESILSMNQDCLQIAPDYSPDELDYKKFDGISGSCYGHKISESGLRTVGSLSKLSSATSLSKFYKPNIPSSNDIASELYARREVSSDLNLLTKDPDSQVSHSQQGIIGSYISKISSSGLQEYMANRSIPYENSYEPKILKGNTLKKKNSKSSAICPTDYKNGCRITERVEIISQPEHDHLKHILKKSNMKKPHSIAYPSPISPLTEKISNKPIIFETQTVQNPTKITINDRCLDSDPIKEVETFYLGFRGQALYTISQICDLKITSRTEQDVLATEYCLKTRSSKKLARNVGTTVTINNLFHNCLIRKKENMENIKKHVTKILAAIKGFCLTYNVKFNLKFKKKTYTEIGTGSIINYLQSRFYGLFENGRCLQLIKDKYDLFVSTIPYRNKTCQFFLFFKRPVVCAKLANMISKLSKKHRLDGNMAYVILLKDTADFNVNVDKSEVIFENENIIFNEIILDIDRHLSEHYFPTINKFFNFKNGFVDERFDKNRIINFSRMAPESSTDISFDRSIEADDIKKNDATNVHSEDSNFVDVLKGKDFHLTNSAKAIVSKGEGNVKADHSNLFSDDGDSAYSLNNNNASENVASKIIIPCSEDPAFKDSLRSSDSSHFEPIIDSRSKFAPRPLSGDIHQIQHDTVNPNFLRALEDVVTDETYVSKVDNSLEVSGNSNINIARDTIFFTPQQNESISSENLADFVDKNSDKSIQLEKPHRAANVFGQKTITECSPIQNGDNKIPDTNQHHTKIKNPTTSISKYLFNSLSNNKTFKNYSSLKAQSPTSVIANGNSTDFTGFNQHNSHLVLDNYTETDLSTSNFVISKKGCLDITDNLNILNNHHLANIPTPTISKVSSNMAEASNKSPRNLSNLSSYTNHESQNTYSDGEIEIQEGNDCYREILKQIPIFQSIDITNMPKSCSTQTNNEMNIQNGIKNSQEINSFQSKNSSQIKTIPQLHSSFSKIEKGEHLSDEENSNEQYAFLLNKKDHGCIKSLQNNQSKDLIILKEDLKNLKVLGQFNKGFILTELIKNNTTYIIIIDQHAADEIYNYEYLIKNFKLKQQSLLIPLKLAITIEDDFIISSNIDIFKRNGFDVDENMCLKTVPIYKNKIYDLSDFYELLENIKNCENEKNFFCSKTHEIMASKACRSSIMIGSHLSTSAMSQILKNLTNLHRPWNCPHGRPVMRVLMRFEN